MSFLSSIGKAVGAAVNAVTDAVSGAGNSGGSTSARDMWEMATNNRIQVRDHRTSEEVPSDRGDAAGGSGRYARMLEEGDFRGIVTAAANGDKAAKEFLKENAQAIQIAIQDEAFLNQMFTNVLNVLHQTESAVARNIVA